MAEPTDIGSPVKDFVKEFLKQAKEGLVEEGFMPCNEQQAHVKVELNATEVQEASGGLKIHIFNVGGRQSDSKGQKMTIFAKVFDESDEAQKKADIAEARKREQEAIEPPKKDFLQYMKR